ncbi:TetR/AcrR family transcriptional regulator [bacterium SCSIO 12741]|nr:TetR/AcrR family transcriptional regulator [bacterium SCSIO 12741]
MPKIIATKEHWLELGYQEFSDKGSAGLVIEKMAQKLKVNKSSFYWHFSTKKDFLKQLVDYWILENTSKIIEAVNAEKSARERFEKLIELSFKKDPYIDFFFFLKKLAKADKKLFDLIDSIDRQRIEYTSQLLVQMGFSEEEANLKAGLFYKYLIGYHEMIRYKKQSKDYLKEVKKELSQFLVY